MSEVAAYTCHPSLLKISNDLQLLRVIISITIVDSVRNDAMPAAASPANAALTIPEVLETVLEQLIWHQRTLRAASVVNRFWWYCAIRLLYQNSDQLMRVAAPRLALIALTVDRFCLKLRDIGDNVGLGTANFDAANEGAVTDLDFPRLRHLQMAVSSSYNTGYDHAMARFLQQRCCSTRLASIFVSLHEYYHFYVAVSPRLFTLLAERRGLRRLHLFNLLVPYIAPKMHGAATTAATATASEYSRGSARDAYFVDLQHFEATVAPRAVAVLARLLPDTLTVLHLQIADAADPQCSRCSGSVGGSHAEPAPPAAVGPPLTQLFGTRRQMQHTDEHTDAAATGASRFTNLRELKLLYERGPDSGAELSLLRNLPLLEMLTIGAWDGNQSGRLCRNCSTFHNNEEQLDVRDFTDDDLARMLAGLPLLRQLSLRLRSALSDGALKIVGRACRQMSRLDLGGSFDLHWACLTAEAEVGQWGAKAPLFPHLASLMVTRFSQHNDHGGSPEPLEPMESADFAEMDMEEEYDSDAPIR